MKRMFICMMALSLALHGAVRLATAASDGCQATVTAEMLSAGYGQAGSAAEWLQAKTVVVHTPGDEILNGLAHPAAALFERPFSLEGARSEHQAFICLMKERGVQVLRLTDILLAGTLDANGRPLPGKHLEQLQALARDALDYKTEKLPKKLAAGQEKYKQQVVTVLHPRELVTIILLRPTVTLQSTGGHNTGRTPGERARTPRPANPHRPGPHWAVAGGRTQWAGRPVFAGRHPNRQRGLTD